MNEAEHHEELLAYLEGLLDAEASHRLEERLRSEPAYRAELEALSALRDRLVRRGEALARQEAENRVMDCILREETLKKRRIIMRRRYGRAGLGLGVAAAAAVVLSLIWPATQNGKAYAAEVFRQGIEALSNLKSVHIKAHARTLPRDNFELIGLDYDFVTIDMWKQFGSPPKWRVEKSGRVVVMDGESSLLLIRPNHACKGGRNPGFVGWMQFLLDVDQVLAAELRLAEQEGSDVVVAEEKGADGASKTVVTVEAKAQGEYSNDWLKNKSISDSNNRRAYRFDAKSGLLEELQIVVHADDGRDVVIFEVTAIEYNPVLDPSLFAITLPDDVIWLGETPVLPDNERYAQMTPDETARAFFQACAERNWDEVIKYLSQSSISERFKESLGGLEIIGIGEPFKSGRYPGWFVPYEIKLRSGDIRKFNLALRNDNPAKRYVVDGGL